MKKKLSLIEHLYWLGSLERPENFAITARIQGSFSVNQLRKALLKLKQRHQLLAVRIVLDSKELPFFSSEGVSEFSIREILSDSDEDQVWHCEVEKELKTPFSWQEGPLVRFVMVKASNDIAVTNLIVVCDHSVTDGLSVAYLIRDILQQLEQPNCLEFLPEIPPIEELLPPQISNKFSLRFYLMRFIFMVATLSLIIIDWLSKGYRLVAKYLSFFSFPQSEKKNPNNLDILEEEGSKTGNRCLDSWSLTEAETSALINRCRQEKTSVHAAICTAFLLTFNRDKVSWTEKVGSPVNVRNRLTYPVGEAFGFFAARVETSLTYTSNKEFWRMAREFKQGLNEQTTDNKLLAPFTVLKALKPLMFNFYLKKYLFRVLKLFENRRVYLDISNLGRLNFPIQYGSLKLIAVYGPIVSTYEDKVVLGVTTVGNKLFLVSISANQQSLDTAKIAVNKIKQAIYACPSI